ncbi:MerR family transcriptional regulator [Solimonas fluminis]|uniref:MerR family transcriptional regulator n=1 Tax=Solimonas fluminis TaxID=2086571 RepID=A0A2S5TCN8_9GAMM|nr:MerR family transcriptional regulator [Solimonas fluminis]PPE72692.1 MerR family transcriptional regulator [Solimonas fluminis]
MRIGDIARQAGTTPKAIRHYELLGILPAVPRQGSYRRYSERDLMFVRLVRQAQALGFRLAELRGLYPADGEPDWSRVLAALLERRRQVAADIQRLQALDLQLQAVEAETRACLGGGGGECAAAPVRRAA